MPGLCQHGVANAKTKQKENKRVANALELI